MEREFLEMFLKNITRRYDFYGGMLNITEKPYRVLICSDYDDIDWVKMHEYGSSYHDSLLVVPMSGNLLFFFSLIY